MAKIDTLLKHALKKTDPYILRAGLIYNFSALTTDELKELAYGNPTDERMDELIQKMNRGSTDEKIKQQA